LDKDKLSKLYPILGQVLDGIWFLETEKRLGFDKALEIDKAVWEIYTINETKRILSVLLENPEDRFNFSNEEILNLLEQVLKISLFNQSVEYIIEKIPNNGGIIFKVINCKTLKGMKKVGRPIPQMKAICKDVGLIYYKNMVKELHPKLDIECLSIPESYESIGNSVLCSWKIFFKID